MPIYNDKKNKINFLTELYLSYRGRKDARTKTIRMNSNGSLESPFIRKEISLCSAAIEEQKIALIEKLLEENIKLRSFKTVLDKHYVALKTIRGNEINLGSDIFEQYTNDSNDSVNDLMKYYDVMSNNFAHTIRTHLLDIEVCNVDGSIAQNNLNIKKEYETTYVKCLKYVDILFARLFAYWSGVLKGETNGAKYTTYFAYDEIRSELIAKLNEIQNIELSDIESVILNDEV